MPSRFTLRQAVRCFYTGGIIAYPTESVFGLGCDPLNASAVEDLLTLKNRHIEKGLILLSDDIEKIIPFIDIDNIQKSRLMQPQTTPTTWLVDASTQTPYWIKGQHKKVAIRITQHPIANLLCQQLPHPIVSTSANLSGRAAARNPLQLQRYFKKIDIIIHGSVGEFSRPSQIIDLNSQKIIRP